MANRMISYGYGIENGKIAIIPSEAEIVKQIFAEYLNGKILKEIAADLTARGVVFFERKSDWNKNTVVRIIQNGKYIGEKDYPAIISVSTFEQANKKKSDKGHKKEKQPEVIEYLKTVVFCGECGKPYHRRVNWGTREKWFCNDGCKCAIYVDDNAIFRGIQKVLCAVKDNTRLLNNSANNPTYIKTQEIIRYTNEIGRYMNERAPSFNAGKKLIMECAALKFSTCVYNANGTIATHIVEQVLKEQEYLSKDFLRRIIEKIIIDKDGILTIRFIGGIEVSESKLEEQYGSAS